MVVPFPFTDREAAKRRPAIVLSQALFNRAGHCVLAMVTTKDHEPRPGDVEISDLKAAGLKAPCIVRLKLFTLDNRLIVAELGQLSPKDSRRVAQHLKRFIV